MRFSRQAAGERPARHALWLVLSLLGALACQSDDAPPAVVAPPAAAVVANTVAKGGNDTVALPTPQKPAFVYSFAGKRDPFRSYLVELHEVEQAKNDARVHEPTEEYDTSQFRLTAIISGGRQPSAMVEDPLGRGHVLKIGGRIGKNNGRVTNIDNTGMSIVEQFYDGTGKRLEVGSVLRLPSNDEGAPGAL